MGTLEPSVISLSYTVHIFPPQSPARKTIFSVKMESVSHWWISVTVFHTVRMAQMKHTVVRFIFRKILFISLTSTFGFYRCERKIMTIFIRIYFGTLKLWSPGDFSTAVTILVRIKANMQTLVSVCLFKLDYI